MATHTVTVRLSRSAVTAPALGAPPRVLQSELVPRREGLRLADSVGDAESPRAPAPQP